MRKSVLVFCLAAGLTACSRGEDTRAEANADENLTAEETSALGNDTTANSAMPTDAAGFAGAVASSDMFEIQSAELAAQKAQSAEVKSFAAQLRTDHEKSTADLKTAAASSNVTVAPAMDEEKQGMLDKLKAASGADFDRQFVEIQKAAHENALNLLQNYASSGDNPALKDFAAKASKVVQGHLDHANGMRM